jgi:TPR repeat protein
MCIRFPIALVLSIFCLALPAWADFQAGMTAHDREDYATALREWQPLAEQGNALAQYHVGMLYHKGRGVPQDDRQARKWYAKAAAQGQPKAQFSLGTLYFKWRRRFERLSASVAMDPSGGEPRRGACSNETRHHVR